MKLVLLPLSDADTAVVAEARAAHPTGDPGDITVIASTLCDATVHGLRFCPDIDALLMPPTTPVPGGAVTELAAYRVDADWFEMTERTLAAAVLRTRLLGLGYPLSRITQAMSTRFAPDYTLLPLTDDPVESHALVGEEAWPIRRWLAEPQEAKGFVATGLDTATAGPGVLRAVRQADVVLLAGSRPAELGLAACLSLPGMAEALRGTRGTVGVLATSPGAAEVAAGLGVATVQDVSEFLATAPVAAGRPAPTVWDRR